MSKLPAGSGRARLRAGPVGSGRAHTGLAAGARASSPPPARSALALVVAALALAGCGADYPDLMVVTRSGSLPGARLTMLVNDGGTVRCNDGPEHQMPARALLDAREIARDLAEQAARDLTLPRPPGALLRFHLRTQEGTVTFSDADAADRPLLGRLVALTRTVAKDVCELAR